MVGGVLTAIGVALMAVGVALADGWLRGKSNWFGADTFDRPGASKTDRLLLYVTFIALVIAPLLGGAILIAFGLQRMR